MHNLAGFKRRVKLGVKMKTIRHQGVFVGRDENGKAQYMPVEIEPREVSIVQSNAFALKTRKSDGSYVDSWCHFPKASECYFRGGVIDIKEEETSEKLILSYSFV